VPGRNYNRLFELAASQYGFITPRDCEALGIDPHRLAVMAHRGTLERIGHGIYRFPLIPPTPLDGFMQAALWPRGLGVISHISALQLHGLSALVSEQVHVTVPAGFRMRRWTPPTYVLHRRNLGDGERTLHEGIPVVTPGRAIADAIDARIDRELIWEAIDAARARGLLGAGDLELIAGR
jgi:predicted transcriptional regulator of viral defense system